jgi:xanthine dehydrogenase YagR molybdenum-binding subunit
MPLEFNAPAGDNLFDKAKVVGKSTPRIDGPRKTTGTAPYAYERHDVAPNQAYGYIVGAGIGKGRIISMDASRARAAPGVLAVITAPETKPVGTSNWNNAPLFGGPDVAHYHQAIACVVAETFEQARAAAALIRTRYERGKGRFDFPALAPSAPLAKGRDGKPDRQALGDFDTAYASAAVKLDETYHTSDESHSMMEPHATIAAWEGDTLTLWTANQMIDWARQGMAAILGIDPAKVRVDSPYIGGGFGGKLFIRDDAVLAALSAKQVGRPVKIALQRPLMANNTTHRHATIQRVRIGCAKDGRISAIAHENWSGNINGEDGENGTLQTPKLYAGANRLVANYIATLDMPEGNAMRAPGEAPGHMALEVAMDEMAEKLGLDPIAFRILNEPEVVPGDPSKKFSDRNLVRCLREGAKRFNWNKRNARPAQVRDGHWLVGMGVSTG